jgi:hypothetical protein
MISPRRITQASVTPDNAKGNGDRLPGIQVEYSSISAFNCDATRLLLLHFSYFALYDGSGKYLFDCTENGRFEVNASSRPRWSTRHPEIFYYLRGNQVKAYNTLSRTSILVKTFSEYQTIDDGGEADFGIDGRVRVLCGDHREIFVFNVGTGEVGPKLATDGRSFNSLYLALNGYQFLVSWDDYGTGPFQGIWVYDWDLKNARNLAPVQGHMDVGRDTDGSDVLIWASGADKQPLCGGAGTGIVRIPLSGAAPSCITTFPWALALHISCPMKRPGEFCISTYGSVPGAIWRCGMHTPSKPEKLIDLQHVATSYEQEPKVSCSRDGSTIVFIEGNDVYMADLTVQNPPSPVPSEPSTLVVEAKPGTLPPKDKRWSRRGRFLYQDDEPVGLMDSPDLTAQIIERMNS